jgi:hypothetical protein
MKPNLNNLKRFSDLEPIKESLIFPLVQNPIQKKVSEIKETWGRIRKHRSLISTLNLDEDKWQLEEGEDLSSHWFHSTIQECLADYKKLKKIPAVQEQTISDLDSFHKKLLFIEQNLKEIGNKVK